MAENRRFTTGASVPVADNTNVMTAARVGLRCCCRMSGGSTRSNYYG
jgi:hypothetical protein